MCFKRPIAAILTTLTLLCSGAGLEAKTLERAEDALKRLFPEATFERVNLFLSDTEQKQAGELLGAPLEKALLTAYVVKGKEGRIATAYLGAHRVRTMPETLMVTVNEADAIVSVDVLAFREPMEYMPKRPWYAQFTDQSFGRKLQLNRDIQGVTGATLTGRATVNAVREILCIHAVLQDR